MKNQIKENELLEELNLDFQKEAERIRNFIKEEVLRLKKDGVIIGLSGGLDSSSVAYLAKRALGKEKVFGLILPERDSDPKNIEDAKRIAKELNLNVKEIDLTPFLEKFGAYQLPVEKFPQNKKLAEAIIKRIQKIIKEFSLFSFGLSSFYEKRGLIDRSFLKYGNEILALTRLKTRLRMVFLYYYGALKNFLVLGTSDKTEWQIGYYDGDAIVECQPLIHLYKTQIKKLALTLGLPKYILEKPSSGDLFGRGIANEVIIGMPYETLDSILYGLEKNLPIEEITNLTGRSQKEIESISQLTKLAKIRKSLPSAIYYNTSSPLI